MRKLLLIATLSLSLATFALAQAGGPVGSSDSVEGLGTDQTVSGTQPTPGSNQPGMTKTESNPQTGSQSGTQNESQPGSMGSSTGSMGNPSGGTSDQGTINNGTGTGTTGSTGTTGNSGTTGGENGSDQNMNSAPSSDK